MKQTPTGYACHTTTKVYCTELRPTSYDKYRTLIPDVIQSNEVTMPIIRRQLEQTSIVYLKKTTKMDIEVLLVDNIRCRFIVDLCVDPLAKKIEGITSFWDLEEVWGPLLYLLVNVWGGGGAFFLVGMMSNDLVFIWVRKFGRWGKRGDYFVGWFNSRKNEKNVDTWSFFFTRGQFKLYFQNIKKN